jgi:hypothetical protein
MVKRTSASETANLPANVGSETDSTTAVTRRRGTGRPFSPGHDPRRNLAGGPRKGESFADKYLAATEAHADELIAAHVKRAKTISAVGARDFELAAAYHMGRPVEKHVRVNTDVAGMAWLQRLAGEPSDITQDAADA